MAGYGQARKIFGGIRQNFQSAKSCLPWPMASSLTPQVGLRVARKLHMRNLNLPPVTSSPRRLVDFSSLSVRLAAGIIRAHVSQGSGNRAGTRIMNHGEDAVSVYTTLILD